jgi:hypothetical protein
MIQQLIEIRNNILSALEQNDNILAKMAINDLDTLLYKVKQEEKETTYTEKEVYNLLEDSMKDCHAFELEEHYADDYRNLKQWFDKNKKQ